MSSFTPNCTQWILTTVLSNYLFTAFVVLLFDRRWSLPPHLLHVTLLATNVLVLLLVCSNVPEPPPPPPRCLSRSAGFMVASQTTATMKPATTPTTAPTRKQHAQWERWGGGRGCSVPCGASDVSTRPAPLEDITLQSLH